MLYEQKRQAATNDIVAELEDELRETKTQVAHLQQGLDHANAQIQQVTALVHQSEDTIASLVARLEEMPRLVSQMNQTRDTMIRAEDLMIAAEQRFGEELRLQQVELDRYRHNVNEIARRVDVLDRSGDGWSARCDALEEAGRYIQEAVTLMRQRMEGMERSQESADSRSLRTTESLKRYDNELARLSIELEATRQADALTLDRTQVYADSIKRLEAQISSVASEVSDQRGIFEQLDLLRAELHRLEDRVSTADGTQDVHRGQLDDQQRVLALLDGKDRGFAERLSLLQEELETFRVQMADQFQRLHQALDRQKRRQIEDIERDMRDLKVTAFRPPEESTGGQQGRTE